MTGRPTDCNEALTALVVTRITSGAPVNIACQAEGIAKQTLSDWNAKAAQGREPYRTFADAVARAHAQFIAARVTNIVNAGFAGGADGGGDWKADAFLAERMAPEELAPSQTIVIKARSEAVAETLALLRDAAYPLRSFADVVALLAPDSADEDRAEH